MKRKGIDLDATREKNILRTIELKLQSTTCLAYLKGNAVACLQAAGATADFVPFDPKNLTAGDIAEIGKRIKRSAEAAGIPPT